MKCDGRIDDYIARQADFARPLLTRIRAAMHAAHPDIEEGIKWGAPAFLYKGKQVAMMAGFKAHAALNFHHGEQLTGQKAGDSGAMGQFGRLVTQDDVPDEAAIRTLVLAAIALIDRGAAKVREAARALPAMPDDFHAALDAVPAAASTYEGFSPSAQRDYLEWIIEAKRPETRAARIAQAVEWIAEGKRRNWKYEKGAAA